MRFSVWTTERLRDGSTHCGMPRCRCRGASSRLLLGGVDPATVGGGDRKPHASIKTREEMGIYSNKPSHLSWAWKSLSIHAKTHMSFSVCGELTCNMATAKSFFSCSTPTLTHPAKNSQGFCPLHQRLLVSCIACESDSYCDSYQSLGKQARKHTSGPALARDVGHSPLSQHTCSSPAIRKPRATPPCTSHRV